MTETAETRTVEQVEASVETVEGTESQCSNCEQWYRDDDQLVPVVINPSEDEWVADDAALLCEHCAETLFGYDGPADGTLEQLALRVQQVDPAELKSTVGKLAAGLARLALPLIVIGVSVRVANQVLNSIGPSEVQEFQDPSLFPGILFPLALSLLLIIIAGTIGPSGFYGRRR